MPDPPDLFDRRRVAAAIAILPFATVAASRIDPVSPLVVDSFAAIAATVTNGAATVRTRGWDSPGIGAADYRLIARAPDSGPSRSVIVSRDGHCYALADSGPVEVDRFGAIGNDQTNDREAIQAAIAHWQNVGGTLAFTAGRRYFVGTYSDHVSRIFMIDHLRDATIDGRGARLRAHSAGDRCQTYLFTFRDFRNLTIRSLAATDTGTNINVEWRGLYFVSPDANLGSCENLLIEDVTVTDAVAFLYVAGTLSQRVRGIRIVRSTALRCYYGMVFAENGDDVHATLKTRGCRRSYFAYGITNHHIRLEVEHDGASPGADACCLIKRYFFDTHKIVLAITLKGSAARFANLVKIEHQPAPGTIARVDDISVTFDIRHAFDLANVVGVGFSSYAKNVLEAGPTHNVWSNITISGDIDRAGTPFRFYSLPPTPVVVYLKGRAAKASVPAAPGFTIVRQR